MPAGLTRFLDALHRGKLGRSLLIAAFAVGVVGFSWAAYQSRFNLSNVDAISYISIARQYASGLIDPAINAYWSPMVSWLLVPFLWLGVDAVAAFNILNAIAATVATAVGALFVWRHSGRHFWATLVFLVCAVAFFLGNMPNMTPDHLVVAWTIIFGATLVEIDRRLRPGTRRERILAGVVLGVLGAIGYWTKLFLLPVFVLTVAVWLVVRWFVGRARGTEPERRTRARSTALIAGVGLAAFAVVIAPWTIALAAKYGEFTLGSSFSVNVSQKFDPDAAEALQQKDPYLLAPPPNEYAVSFGEDRTFQVEARATGSTAGPVERLTHYLGQRIKGFPWYMEKLASIAPFAVPSMALLLLGLIFRLIPYRQVEPTVIAGLVWGSYFLGYVGIASAASQGGNIRYMWPLFLVSVMVTAILIPKLWERFAAGPGKKFPAFVLALLVALVPIAALPQHGLGMGHPWSHRTNETNGFGYLLRPHNPLWSERFADQLRADDAIPAGSRIAGSNYRLTLRLAFYLDAHVYGSSGRAYDVTDPKFQQVLRDNGIDYWLQYTRVGDTVPDAGEFVESSVVYEANVSCSDDKGAGPEPCRVTIMKLAD